MTREEIEEVMGVSKPIQASFEAIGDDGKFIKLIVNGKEKVVSIEELEKTLPEPCEDCISRAELLKAVDTWDKFGCDADSKLVSYKDCYVAYIHYDDVVKAIKGMPSVQPKPKTGHWISKHIVDDCNGVVTWYECSECGRSVDAPITEEFMLKDYPYCHCGAKMLPTDSEKER